MNQKEKSVLKKAVDSHEGQISPATMINGYAGGDQGLVERLVSQGYLERVYQFREGLRNATYSIIFYTVTEKGWMQFASPSERLWFAFKTNVALWVGVFSIIVGSTTMFFTGAGHLSSIKENRILDRPYYFTESSEIQPIKSEGHAYKVILTFRNTGRTPATQKNLKWGFTQNQELVDSKGEFTANPDSENKAWIFLTKEQVDSIQTTTKNRLIVKLIYSDFAGNQYCTKSEYSTVKPENEYLLSVESISACEGI